MSKTIDGRLAYADLFRTVALVGIILLHVATLYYSASAGLSREVAGIYSALFRWCVPAFAMLSGMFMLEPKNGFRLGDYFLRILRLLCHICLWSAVYVLVDFLLSGTLLSFSGFLTAMESALRGTAHPVFQYIYIILGFYLLAPILRAFVRDASRAELRYALLLSFLVAFLLPALLDFFPNSVIRFYLDQLQLYPVMGCFFYFIAGYYFKHYLIGRAPEMLIYVLGIAGAFLTVWIRSDRLTGILSPTVALTTLAFFILFRYVLGVSDERGRSRGVTAIARAAFGTFLIHEVFFLLLRHFGLFALDIPVALAIPLWTAVLFLPSFTIAWLLGRIPFIGRYIS